MARITLAAFRSRPAVCPQDSQRKVRSPSPGRCLFLAKHSEQVMVVWAGGTSTTFRPARWPHPVSSRLAAPIAASAALRAIVDLARNSGRKSSTAIIWWRSATRRLPTLWTNSYFVATAGGATLEVIKRYVENQRNV